MTNKVGAAALAGAALVWLLNLAGLTLLAEQIPAGLLASASMLISGVLGLAVRRAGSGAGIRWRREHWPVAAVSSGLYAGYMVLAACWASLAGLGELTVAFSLQCLTLLIGLSLVKEQYIRPRTVLSVAVTAIGAVCAMGMGGRELRLVWYLVPLGLLITWTLWLILTLDLAEEYPAQFVVGWQNVWGGLMALSVAVFDPKGIACPGGGALLLFLGGAVLWSIGLPLLLGRLKGRNTISGSLVFGAMPVCGLLGWKLLGEQLAPGLPMLGLGLLCVGEVLACADMLGTRQEKE